MGRGLNRRPSPPGTVVEETQRFWGKKRTHESRFAERPIPQRINSNANAPVVPAVTRPRVYAASAVYVVDAFCAAKLSSLP
jgi:hypothetical protein